MYLTPGWHYAHSENGYNNSKISLEWLKRVFDAQTKEHANQKPQVLKRDSFGTYEMLEILEYCFENNIILCRLPSHTFHKLHGGADVTHLQSFFPHQVTFKLRYIRHPPPQWGG